jgi:ABC-type bacteriocin/lantibiotic exporter with double-glycine peptidase domain
MAIHALFVLLIGCILMAQASPLLTALIFGLLAVSIGVQIGFGRLLERAFDNVQREMAKLAAFA